MKVREIAEWAASFLVLAAAAVVASCTPVAGPGPDRSNRTEVTTVNWTDNRPAYQVNCEMPGGCGERINAVCNQGAHQTLKSENMPGPGNIRDVQKPATVVFRCR
jgi:hypothetical protein